MRVLALGAVSQGDQRTGHGTRSVFDVFPGASPRAVHNPPPPMNDSDAASKNAATSGTHLWLVMMKAHRSMARHAARSLDPFDLGLSEFATLELLLHKGPHKVNDIGRRIDLTSGSITTAVDRLEARGLVVRGFDEADRRSRIVRLTPKGRKHITRVFASHAATLDAAAEGLSKQERKTLIALLKKLGMFAQQAAEAADAAESGARAK